LRHNLSNVAAVARAWALAMGLVFVAVVQAADYVRIPDEPNTFPGIRPPRDFAAPRDTVWSIAGGCVAIRGPMGHGGVVARHSKQVEAIRFTPGPNGVAESALGDDTALGPATVGWAIRDTAWDAHSGVHALTDSPSGLYGASWNFSARLATGFDLTGATEATLTFWHHWNLRYNTAVDSAIVQVRANGGAWVSHRAFTNSGGFVGAFLPETIDLTPFAGSTIEIRFTLRTSSAFHDDGWVVDDVLLLADGEVLVLDDFETGLDGWVLEGQWGLNAPFTSFVTTNRNESLVTFPVSHDRFGTPLAVIDGAGVVTTNPVGLPTFIGEGTGILWVVADSGSSRQGTMIRVTAPSFVAE
jgi:hypothetical protein